MPGNFRHVVLLYADLVESTRWQARYGLDAYQAMRRMVDAHMADAVHAAGDGREMEKEREGDSRLIWFERADKAVAAALWWRRLLASDPAWPAEWERMAIRIGISQGSVDFSSAEADKAGLVLNKSARIDDVAIAGQILLEKSVYDSALELAGQSFREHLPGAGDRFPAGALRWERHGEYEFKGFGSTRFILYELYAPSWGEESKGPPRDSEKGGSINRRWRPEAGKPVLTREEYILEKKLGEGGFGEVWVAAKTPAAGTGGKPSRRVFKFCFQEERRMSFRREQTFYQMIRTNRPDQLRHFVPVDRWQLDKLPYYLESELIVSGNLLDWSRAEAERREAGVPDEFRSVGAVPLSERLRLFGEVASAVDVAHSMGIIHRDIKPQNVLIGLGKPDPATGAAAPFARIGDFGIGTLSNPQILHEFREDARVQVSLAASSDLLLPGSSRTGTRIYAPPEYLRDGAESTVKGDVYSLGVLLYQLVAGDFGEAPGRNWQKRVSDPALGEAIEMAIADAPDRLAKASELASLVANREQRNRELRRAGRMRWAGVAAVWLLVIAAAAGYGMWRAILAERKAEGEKLIAEAAERRMEEEKAAAEAAERKALRLADAGGKFANRSLTELLDALDNTPGSASIREVLIRATVEYIEELRAAATADGDFALLFIISDAYRKLGNVYKTAGLSKDASKSYWDAQVIDHEAEMKALDYLNAHNENIGGHPEDLLSLSSGYYQYGMLVKLSGYGGEQQLRAVEACYANVLRINKTLIGKIEERLRRSDGSAEAAAFMQLEYIYSQLGHILEYSVSASGIIARPSGASATTGIVDESKCKFASESRILLGEAERVFREAKELGRFEELSRQYNDIKNGKRDDIPVFGDIDRTIVQMAVNFAHLMFGMFAIEDTLGIMGGSGYGLFNETEESPTEFLSWISALRRVDVQYPIPHDQFLPVAFRDPALTLATALSEALFAVRRNSPEVPPDAKPSLRNIGDVFSRVLRFSVEPNMTVEQIRVILYDICHELEFAILVEAGLDCSSGRFDNFEIYDAVVNLHRVLRITSPREVEGAPDNLGRLEEDLEDLAGGILGVIQRNAFQKDVPIPSHKLRKKGVERQVNDTLADIERFLGRRLERMMTTATLPSFSTSHEVEDWKRSMENALSDARELWDSDKERREHGLLYSKVMLLNVLLRNMASEGDSASKRNSLAECITALETLDREMNGAVERMKVLLMFAHGMLGKNYLESNLVDEAETHFVREAEYIDMLTGEDASLELWPYRIASLGNRGSLLAAKGRFEEFAAIYSELIGIVEDPLLSKRTMFLLRETEQVASGAFELLRVMLNICGVYCHDDKGEAYYSEITGIDSAEARARLVMVILAMLGDDSPFSKALYWNNWGPPKRIGGESAIEIARRNLNEMDMKDLVDTYKSLMRGGEYNRWCAFWR